MHRDLKPANILVSDRGVVRLLDYGVASFADLETLTLDGEVVGTPRYLAPEQVSGAEVGPPADVYALGLVLIECLTGRHPFGGTAIESMGARLTRDPDLPDGIDDRWTALLAAMTARYPLRRPSAAGVAERMGALGASADLRPPGPLDPTTVTSIDACRPVRRRRTRRRRPRRRRWRRTRRGRWRRPTPPSRSTRPR